MKEASLFFLALLAFHRGWGLVLAQRGFCPKVSEKTLLLTGSGGFSFIVSPILRHILY